MRLDEVVEIGQLRGVSHVAALDSLRDVSLTACVLPSGVDLVLDGRNCDFGPSVDGVVAQVVFSSFNVTRFFDDTKQR